MNPSDNGAEKTILNIGDPHAGKESQNNPDCR